MSSNLQLLSPLTVGGQQVKNRLVLAPLTRARGTVTEDPLDPVSNVPNDLQAEYYEQRASAGILITEATAISEEASGWRNAPHIKTQQEAQGWKKVVDRVHARDGIIYLQLWHMGRQSHSSFHPSTERIVAPSAIPMEGTQVRTAEGIDVDAEVPHALTVEEIQDVKQDYVRAAKLAAQAGFDGIQVHAANGYLMDQFLQSSTNHRDDRYGGSKENRVRMLQEVIDAIVESGAFPANRIAVRLSPNGTFGNMGSEDNFETFIHVAKVLNSYGLAFLDVMDGLGFGYHGKDKAVTLIDIRKVFDGIVMFNVGLTKDIAEGIIRSGAGDMAAFGRLYMSNPDLAERFANNWEVTPEAPYETWYAWSQHKGYTDWPTYKLKVEEIEEEKKEEN